MQPSIREAIASDSARIAQLCVQLGSPISVEHALYLIEAPAETSQIFVAVVPRVGVVGLGRIAIQQSLLRGPFAYIDEMIVDREYRGEGIGTLLLQALERWARRRGFLAVLLNTHTDHDRTHDFYLKRGYELLETEHMLSKRI